MAEEISLAGVRQARVAEAAAEIPPLTGRVHILEHRPPGVVFVSTPMGLHVPSCIPNMQAMRRGFEEGMVGKTLVVCDVELTAEQFLSPLLVLPPLSVVTFLQIEDSRLELVPDFRSACGWASRCFISSNAFEVRRQARALICRLTTRNTVNADAAFKVMAELHSNAGFESDIMNDFDVRMARYVIEGRVEA